MQVLQLMLHVMLLINVASADDFSRWLTQVRAIKKEASGDFSMTFQRMTDAGQDQKVTLIDNDGIATLAVTQLILVEHVKKAKQSGKSFTLDSDLSEVFRDGESRILSIQKDALTKLRTVLEKTSNAGQGGQRLSGTNETVDSALKITKQMLGRFDLKVKWRLMDIENFGSFIQKILGGGGPYYAEYNQGGKSAGQFKDILIDNTEKPLESFLSGTLRDGFYLPSAWVGERPIGVSKSHRWIDGSLSELQQKYSSENAVHSSREQRESPALQPNLRIKTH